MLKIIAQSKKRPTPILNELWTKKRQIQKRSINDGSLVPSCRKSENKTLLQWRIAPATNS